MPFFTDTTKIELIGQPFDKIVDSLTHHTSTGTIAIIAAAIGASAAILSQVVVYFLTKHKERKNKINELIAEERRIAYLLTEYYKELVMHKVHKTYWYRTSIVHSSGEEDSKDSHNRHFISNERSFETLRNIRITTSEYFKTVTLFTNLSGINDNITQSLEGIKSFIPRKASDFSNITTYEELLTAQSKEEQELNKEYLIYSVYYNRIYNEMVK